MWRSILFVTGNRPDRFDKALAGDADAICIDLEDGVPPADKAPARDNCAAALEKYEGNPRVLYRINHPETADGAADLALFRGRPLAGLLIPKAEQPEDLAAARAAVGAHVLLMAIIESARGMVRAFDIAGADGVGAIIFGSADWTAETGSDSGWDALLYARSLIVHAAAVARIPPLDGPFLNVRDSAGLEQETRRLRSLGFRGRVALHPDQTPVINAGFAPDAEQLRQARKLIDAFEAEGGKTILVDGRMIDRPVYEAARRLLQHG